MSDSLRLGRFRGISIGLHWSVAIFAAFISWNLARIYFPAFAPGHSGGTYLAAGLIAATLLAGSILAHELGHALVAIRHGIGINGITLWLMGGVARLESEARTPRHAFEIAAAGPAVSFAVALGSAVAAGFSSFIGLGALVTATLGYLALVNVGLGVFNLIPALPLDGGRILHAWKWHKGGDREVATVDAAKIGRLLGMGIVGFGVVQLLTGIGSGLWGILVGLFVMRQAKAERRHAERRIALRQRPAMPQWFSLLQRLATTSSSSGPAAPGPRSPYGGTVYDTTATDSAAEQVPLRRID